MSKEDVEVKKMILADAARRVAHLADLCMTDDGAFSVARNEEAYGSLKAAIATYRKEKKSLEIESHHWLMYAVQNLVALATVSPHEYRTSNGTRRNVNVSLEAWDDVKEALKALGLGPTSEAF
jgi:hypothetical protein